MKAGRLVVAAIFLAAGVVVYAGYALRRATAPRSIVLISIDTLRADRLGAYGRSPSITPSLDALAARGVVFEKAWTTAPLTVPAHASLLTGLLPPKHGLRLNQPAPLPPRRDRGFFTLAEALKEKGYATGAFVSASVLRADETGFQAGFDVYDDVPRAAPGSAHDTERPGRGEETVQHALAWLGGADRPAFVWIHLFDPHGPYDAPAGWGAGKEHTADSQGYDAEVAYTDHCVGLLLDGLAKAGLADAVIAVVADHGESLGEHGEPTHGYLLHEATLHVPLVFATPGLPAARRQEPVSVVDVFPSVLALAGIPLPPGVRESLFETKRGAPDDPSARPIYAETLYAWDTCRWAQCFALRRGEEKVVSAGATTYAFDLTVDPGEARPSPPSPEQSDAVAQLLRVAREPSLASISTPASGGPSGSYWSSGSASNSPVLADEANAKLASPYDRMDVLRDLDAARALLAAGRTDDALAAFERIAAKDPGNILCIYWRARCLEANEAWTETAEAYRRSWRMGMRARVSVSKALQSSWKAGEGSERSEPDPSESERALAFLAEVRAQGAPDDAAVFLMEGMIRLQREELEPAEEAFRRADSAPGADAVREGLRKAQELLDAIRRQRDPRR